MLGRSRKTRIAPGQRRNPVFGWLVSRFRRIAFVSATYRFFAFGLLAFYALLELAPKSIGERSGRVFYVWFSVFRALEALVSQSEYGRQRMRFTLPEMKRPQLTLRPQYGGAPGRI